MIPTASGMGAGERNPHQVANLVRVLIGDATASREAATPVDVVELASNLDDCTGEILAAALQRLLAEGALDAWVVPATMKKGRPGFVLHALCAPHDADRLSGLILRDTPTLGVRAHPCHRRVLDRWVESVETPYGTVRVKVGGEQGHALHAAPEFDDVIAHAGRAGVPPQEVYRAAIAAWSAQKAG
jgi:uncharacterized protein (DUF111 family)